MSATPVAGDREASEAAFEALLHRPGDVIVIVDDRLRILRASPSAGGLAERATETLPGMSLIAAFGSAELDSIAREPLTTRRPASGEANLGHLSARTFRVDALPTTAGGVVVALRDISAVRRMERMRRDFVANITHELRTPLASIKLLAETLSSGVTDDASGRELAVQIEREVDHLAQLVDELLDLSRIESGETKLQIEPVDPDEVLSEVVERMRPLAERRSVTLRSIAPPERSGTRAAADAARLSQALVNLTHNAVKFSHPDGEVRVAWQELHDRIRFSVSDDGIGIPEWHRSRIFERFYKVDRSRARTAPGGAAEGGSAGLGLAIVRHIAEAHRGSVGVESQEGVGSTFWIEIPGLDTALTVGG